MRAFKLAVAAVLIILAGLATAQAGSLEQRVEAVGKTVDAIGDVYGVARSHHDQNGKRDVQPADIGSHALEEGNGQLPVEAYLEGRIPDAGSIELTAARYFINERSQAAGDGGSIDLLVGG